MVAKAEEWEEGTVREFGINVYTHSTSNLHFLKQDNYKIFPTFICNLVGVWGGWTTSLVKFILSSHSILDISYCCSVTKSCPTLATLWTAAGQASLSFTVSWGLLKFMSIESVIVSNQLILCCPLLLPSSISQHQSLFQGVGSSHQVAKMLNLQLQHQSFQWIFRVDSL